MQERHQNREQYFQEQAHTTRKFVIPYVKNYMSVDEKSRVLEIGCGEGGNLLPFLDLGCQVVGIDLSESRIALSEKFLENHPNRKNLRLIVDDIYNVDYLENKFDLILLRDVIEHIPKQELFMHFVKRFLMPAGKIFFGFPPWQNPFGGHQQIINHKILSRLPYFHLLPKSIYRFILTGFQIPEPTIIGLMGVRETGISIEKFEKILKKEHYTIDRKTLFLINPNYETKFKIKPREQFRLIASIPFIRNIFSTAAYYLVSEGSG